MNNAYLGLIRQAQRGFPMDFEVSLAFENINTAGEPDAGYGVDHVAVAEAMGCKAMRVKKPEEFAAAFEEAKRLMKEHQVPVVLEFILERVTNISMGTEIDNDHRIRGTCRDATRTRRPRSCCSTERDSRGTSMPKFSANLSMLFTEHDFLDRFDAAAKAGFKAVEYIGPYDHAPEGRSRRG